MSNKFKKFKFWFKNNWYKILFVFVSLFILFSCSVNVRYKSDNKLVESEIKQGQVLKPRKNEVLINTNNPYYNANGKVYLYNIDEQVYGEYNAYNAFLDNNNTQFNNEILFDMVRQNPTIDTMTISFESINDLNLNTENITIIAQYSIYKVYISYKDNNVFTWENTQTQDAQFNSKVIIENEIIFDTIEFEIDLRSPAFERLYINVTNDTTQQIYDTGFIDGYNYAKQELDSTINNLLNIIANKDLQIQLAFENGRQQGLSENYSIANEISPLINLPFLFGKGALDFEVYGLNLYNLFVGSITILLIIFVYRKCFK